MVLGTIVSLWRGGSRLSLHAICADPRFWPLMLLALSAVVPWYHSQTILGVFPKDSTINRDVLPPLAIGIEWTHGSLGFPVYNPSFLVEILPRILLFWLPLKAGFSTVGKSDKWSFDRLLGFCILSMVMMAFLVFAFTPILLLPAPGLILVFTAPLLWVGELFIYRWYRVKRNQ